MANQSWRREDRCYEAKLRSMFYRTPLQHLYDTTAPDLPEEIPISWVHYAADFAIVETTIELPPHLNAERIVGNLEALLDSSRVYPPARALAVRSLEDSGLDWRQFTERLGKLLTSHLESQPTSKFRLLRCLKDQGDSLEMGGHGGAGHFYWVLAANQEQLTWVSSHNYLIYSAPKSEFEMSSDIELPAELQLDP